ncbi:MAG: sigma-54 dependent transcriptional regulator [Terriglobales bacterium]
MPPTSLAPLPATTAVIIASGDAVFRRRLAGLLEKHHEVIESPGGADALLRLELEPCAGLLLDCRLPDLDPEELRALVAAQHPQVRVEMLDSAAGPLERLEATGPLDFAGLIQALRAAGPPARGVFAAMTSVMAPADAPIVLRASPPLAAPAPPAAPILITAAAELLPGLVGRSPHLSDLSSLVRLVAPRRTTVLLLGETGTGKDMIASFLHRSSGRSQRPWVVVNCAAIPEALLESELFGYNRGAFTGAVQSRAGRIHTAHTGTLFLDEIGELPLALQSKLLRFLQEGELQRLGSNDAQRVDVRVVAATNQDLVARVEAGQFRRDLYHRLAVFPIELQPLRSRPADIAPLVKHFLRHLQAEAGAPVPAVAPAAMDLLERYPWPGNVRELQHAVERAVILAGSVEILQPQHFPVPAAWQVTRGNGPCRAQEWAEATGTHDAV